MRTLYHLWLSPYCRKVRLALSEKKLVFKLELEKVWERRPEYLALNPAGEVPVFIDEDGTVFADSSAICEYLDEIVPDSGLVGGTARARRGPPSRGVVRSQVCPRGDKPFGQRKSGQAAGG